MTTGRLHPASSVVDWLVVLLLTGAVIFSFVDRFVLSLLIEPIKKDLGLTDSQLGMLNGVAFGLFYAFLSLPMGWLADRWSRKGTIVAGMAIWSAATAGCGFASNFVQLLAFRVGVGAGEAGLIPASYAMIHDRFRAGRLNLAISLFQLGGFIGAGVSILGAGIVYAYFESGAAAGLPIIGGMKPWQQTFAAAALPALFFIPAILALKDRKRSAPDIAEAGAPDLPGRPTIGIYALLFVGMAGHLACSLGIMTWLPAILQREFGWTAVSSGTVYGTVLIIAPALSVLTGGWIADRLSASGRTGAPTLLLVASSAISLPMLALLPLVTNAWSMIAVAAGAHLCLSLSMGVAPSLIQQLTPGGMRSRVSAGYVLVCNIVGLGLGPVLVGWLSGTRPDDPTALRTMLGLVNVAAIILAIALLLRLHLVLRAKRAV